MEHKDIAQMAELLKSIGHPIRLKILCLLEAGEMTVSDIKKEVQTTHANISQHLTILRNQGIIDFRRDANFIVNRICDERVTRLIKTLRQLYCDDTE